jgi:secreted PhoX family phosphatase
MEIINGKSKESSLVDELAQARLSRRKFMRYAGIFGASAAVIGISSCSKDDNNNNNTGIDLGSGDTGVLNYAYALEQLEAAFYIQVVTTPYTGITTTESTYFTDIRDHEIGHREFFKTALAGSAIPALEVNFSAINFASRDSVLATAKAFEDLGVSAYNGAGKLLTVPANLLTAGKIVSVEARHAATIRDMITANSFSGPDVVDAASGLDMARTPAQVLSIASAYLKSKLNASNLPTS